MKIKLHRIVTDAVEAGALLGWRRAHKHTDHPDEDMAAQQIADAVMDKLGEVLDLEDVEIEPKEDK